MSIDHRKAEDLFERALDFAPDQRAAYLLGACGNDVNLRRRVEDLLLAHDANTGFLADRDAESVDTVLIGAPLTECAGTLVGRYKLLEKIGEGGFGVVWAAEQREPVKRRVALKIIKLGMDTKQVVARFEAERQALALMDHPNIARVLDAGATETGRPYFVMELVKGIPITRFCDQERLETERRLNLFIKVCQAIQHAHQKGIIHRDIKPSNILVTLHDGVPVPKVIDFGIAKATQQELTEKTIYTQFSQFIGTPAYMSPEQAEMSGLDIDTRSDIYSLGVLLYEMLTGETPFDSRELMKLGLDEMRRIIREREPVRPSTRVSQTLSTAQSSSPPPAGTRSSFLPSDLDWIAMKALAKDRSRRYETANAFRLDVERFLSNEPVTAVAPSVTYKFRKFARRNKLAFGAATAVVAALVIGLGAALGFYFRERAARTEAVTARAESEIRREQALQAQVAEVQQRRRAEENARRAEQARVDEAKQRYAADMALVQSAAREWDTTLGLTTLNAHVPDAGETDLRGWEWRYLYSQFTSEPRKTRVLPAAHEVAVAPNGRLVAVGGAAESEPGIVILSYPDLKPVRIISRPPRWIAGMWFSADSQSLILEKAGVRRYDLNSESERVLLQGSARDGSWPLKATRDLRWLVGAFDVEDGERELRSFDAATGDPIAVSARFRIQDTGMRDHILQLSPDGSLVAEGCADHLLRIFSVPDLKETLVIPTPGNVSVVAWSPDGGRLATGYDHPFQFDLWDAETGANTGTLTSDVMGPAFDLVFSPDGSRVAACDWKNIVAVWKVETRELIRVVFGDPKLRIPAIVFHPDNRTLIGVGDSGTLYLWDTTADLESELKSVSRDEKMSRFCFSPDSRILAAASPGGSVALFDVETETLIDRLPVPNDHPGDEAYPWASRLVFSSDGRTLVSANGDHTVTIYDVRTRRIRRVLEGHSGPPVQIRISPDDRLIGTVGEDRTVIIWDIDTGKRLHQIEAVNFMDFHPDPASRLIAVSERNTRIVSLVHRESGEREKQVYTVNRNVWSVNFAPDGRTLAVGLEGQVELYRLPDLELDRVIVRPRGPVPEVAFHPDGETLAIPAWGGTCHLWSTRVNGIVARMPVPPDWVVAARFAPDGNTLAVSTLISGIELFRAPPMREFEKRRHEETLDIERFEELDQELAAERVRLLERRFADDPGSINQWLLLGPIPRKDGAGLESEILDNTRDLFPRPNDAAEIDGVEYTWTARRQRHPVFDFSRIYASEASGEPTPLDRMTVYSACYIVCDRPMNDLVLKTGSDDDAILYLNGREIHRGTRRSNPPLDRDEITGVRLEPGLNRLIFRVDNNRGQWGGSVRITGNDGNPVEGLTITLLPDESN